VGSFKTVDYKPVHKCKTKVEGSCSDKHSSLLLKSVFKAKNDLYNCALFYCAGRLARKEMKGGIYLAKQLWLKIFLFHYRSVSLT
jgi:hypothetical protein